MKNQHKFIRLILIPTMLLCGFTMTKDRINYGLFNKNGKSTTYKNLLQAALEADIILFGELHDNAISHELQLQLTRNLYAQKGKHLILGAEMFEKDNQEILTRYVNGEIEESEFEKLCRLWPNYKTDYRPLVEFARVNKLNFIATNVPRKYASLVYKGGFEALDTLSSEAKSWMPPLPILYDSNLNCYKGIFKMAGGHGGQNLPKSQALKDATMAHFILAKRIQGQTFLHINGTYHSNHFESIYWYLKQANPNLKIMTIATVQQKSFKKCKKANNGLADFVIITQAEKDKKKENGK